jgi:hypothetical protein
MLFAYIIYKRYKSRRNKEMSLNSNRGVELPGGGWEPADEESHRVVVLYSSPPASTASSPRTSRILHDLVSVFGGGRARLDSGVSARSRLDSGVSSVRSFSDFDGIDMLPDTLHLPVGGSPQPLFRSGKSVYAAAEQDSKRHHETSSSDAGSVSSSSSSGCDSSDDYNPIEGGLYPSAVAVARAGLQTPLSASSALNKHMYGETPAPPAARPSLCLPIHMHLRGLLVRPQQHQHQRHDDESSEGHASDGTVSDSEGDSDSSDESRYVRWR